MKSILCLMVVAVALCVASAGYIRSGWAPSTPLVVSSGWGNGGWGSSGWGNSGWGNSGWGNSGWGNSGWRGGWNNGWW